MSKAVDDAALSAAAKSVSYNVILQVLMRTISFISNAMIIRYISKDVLGVINVRLMLLYSSTHCLSREAFRRSCLCKFDNSNTRKLINLLWIPIPLCFLTGILLRAIWLYVLQTPDSNTVSHYNTGVNTILVSVVIEMLAEPLHVVAQSFHFIKLKVIIEGLSISLKSLCMVLLLCQWPQFGIFTFCCSQVLASVTYTASYYVYFLWYLSPKRIANKGSILPFNSVSEIFPDWPSKQFADGKTILLTWSFYKQTIVKQLLTEGERYMMTLLNILSFYEQGIYDAVSNLGSLAARFLFLPIEESGYVLFSHLLKRGLPADNKENLDKSLMVLQHLIKLMVLLGLTILVFGFPYSQLLLLLYGGPSLSNSAALVLLRWHCVYIMFLAVNGVTECFVFATMGHQEIDRYNRKMVIFSVIFLFTAYYLTALFGSTGFLLANCINMGCRIYHSFYFILQYFNKKKLWMLQTFIPHSFVLITFGICFSFTSISEAYLCCASGSLLFIHLVFGIIFFILLVGIIFLLEKPLLHFITTQFIKKEANLKKTN